MSKFTSIAVAAIAAALLSGAPDARSATLVSDLTSLNDNGFRIGSTLGPGFGRFTLTGPAVVDSATLLMLQSGSPGNSPSFTVSIFDNAAGVPGSTVYGSVTRPGTVPTSSTLITFTFGTPISLGAGTYWLGLSGSSIDAFWNGTLTADLINTGPAGSVLPPVVFQGGANTNLGYALLFSLSGTVSAVPEPTTPALWALGWAAVVPLVWRSRRQRTA